MNFIDILNLVPKQFVTVMVVFGGICKACWGICSFQDSRDQRCISEVFPYFPYPFVNLPEGKYAGTLGAWNSCDFFLIFQGMPRDAFGRPHPAQVTCVSHILVDQSLGRRLHLWRPGQAPSNLRPGEFRGTHRNRGGSAPSAPWSKLGCQIPSPYHLVI